MLNGAADGDTIITQANEFIEDLVLAVLYRWLFQAAMTCKTFRTD